MDKPLLEESGSRSSDVASSATTSPLVEVGQQHLTTSSASDDQKTGIGVQTNELIKGSVSILPEVNGDFARRMWNGVCWLLIIAQSITLALAHNTAWSNTYLFFDEDINATVSTLDMSDAIKIFRDSDEFCLIKIPVVGMTKFYPIIKICLCAIVLPVMAVGPEKLRRDRNSVAIIRPSSLREYMSASVNETGFRTRLYNVAAGWSAINTGNVAKNTNLIVFMLMFLILAFTNEFKFTDSSNHSIKLESEIKIGVFWFWVTTLLSCFVSMIFRLQLNRWMRREKAMDLFAAARVGIDSDDATQMTDLTITSERSSRRSSGIVDEPSSSSGAQRKATKFAAVAILSYICLFFLPVIRLNFSGRLSANLQSGSSKEYTIFGIVHALAHDLREESGGQLMATVLYVEVALVPMLVLMLCTALKCILHYYPRSMKISTLYEVMMYVQPLGNVEAFTTATFLTVWSIEYVSRHLSDVIGLCSDLPLSEEKCFTVKGEFAAGSWFLLFFTFSLTKCVSMTQQDLMTKVQDLQAMRYYGISLRSYDVIDTVEQVEEAVQRECVNDDDDTSYLSL
uniref:Uncharacterized protein n=1 Tax=Leptocylindrus danicus TaxID=163516 RepID=A0A7S2K8D7_9STRA|mmetsp:Transcript_19710/g.29323  ORF Transcript_19710/g.29323 Transcript_19710/m.29323 type:complete len:567 (+) Transcript_19710:40-1740(+)